MEFTEFFKLYGEYGVWALTLSLTLVALKYSVKQNEVCADERKNLYKEHKEELIHINDRVLSVIAQNTQSATQLSEAVRELRRQ